MIDTPMKQSDTPTICCWCEQRLPKKPLIVENQIFCGKTCHADSLEYGWPSWMAGRIGAKPTQDWHMSYGYLCLSAPNRYRNVFRRRCHTRDDAQAIVMEMQAKEFPHLTNPQGLDCDAGPDGAIMARWDQVLIWLGPTVADAKLLTENEPLAKRVP